MNLWVVWTLKNPANITNKLNGNCYITIGGFNNKIKELK